MSKENDELSFYEVTDKDRERMKKASSTIKRHVFKFFYNVKRPIDDFVIPDFSAISLYHEDYECLKDNKKVDYAKNRFLDRVKKFSYSGVVTVFNVQELVIFEDGSESVIRDQNINFKIEFFGGNAKFLNDNKEI